MFDVGVVYWFVLKGRKGFDEFRLKGKVIEEDSLLVKVETDRGNKEIIPKARIVDVNEARNTDFNKPKDEMVST
jgi:hypothetical protein